ncbi:MAG TPA: MoaD/ThiS family protein [Chitinophagaceae bacterium]|nr:MoaD/ThiS family protein [Chitinophagaceae bacterium]
MQITVSTFGQLAELTSPKIIVSDVADTVMLQQKLEEKYPCLQNITYAITVDKKIIAINTAINAASSVALLPPFSGG